jgi:cyclophilin family peptidyl-prolyl cis-trans isomerase
MPRNPSVAVIALLLLAAPCQAQVRNPEVIMETSLGTVRLELFADKAPVTVANFLKYLDAKSYDGTVFHRVIPNFMIQGGGLTADLKEKRAGAPIANEAGNGLSNARGTLAMARTTDPNSATVQFFINVKDNRFLDRAQAADKIGYAVFGRVTGGMDVVDKIQKVPTVDRGGHANVPAKAVVIHSVRRVGEFSVVGNPTVVPGRLFSVTAFVDWPGRGQALTLVLPTGVERVEGKEIQPVPAASGSSAVLWKARVLLPGDYTLTVRSNTGVSKTLTIKSLPAGGK